MGSGRRKICGASLNSIKIYRAPNYYQRGANLYYSGRGLNNFFKGVSNFILPYLKTAGKSIAKEIFSGGLDVINEIDSNPQNLKKIVKKRAQKGLKNLKEEAVQALKKNMAHQSGSGLKRQRKSRKQVGKNLILNTKRRGKQTMQTKQLRTFLNQIEKMMVMRKKNSTSKKRATKRKRNSTATHKIKRSRDIFD